MAWKPFEPPRGATILAFLMPSRLVWRRSATAVGIYASTALGVLGSLVAANILGPTDFGRLAIVVATTALFQLLLDLTSEEALVKYGFRYSERGEALLRRLGRAEEADLADARDHAEQQRRDPAPERDEPGARARLEHERDDLAPVGAQRLGPCPREPPHRREPGGADRRGRERLRDEQPDHDGGHALQIGRAHV